ncbi:nickel-dependent lactate racemase [Fuchsiella alkaliacetigena]|uniref:nickel-dependent lactate racemase n=1 Tax=Fuchsiella alkaliacetigena TaxID=957042 RepID=UPI00200AC093|nr:nickel-dependent lactate racemase [Fuchsiella alkaliacetigena]MCK8824200.1 nickel-dependent lactate racemase [Fuchsiella alkaliacetigena]
METLLKYGKKKLHLEIADQNYLGTLNPVEVEGVANPLAEVQRALDEPIGSERLRKLVNAEDQVVILASDITRPAPSHILLPPIIEELNEAGVNDEQIKVIFGLGVHRKQTEEEQKKLVGADIYERIECIDHDIDDCVDVGVTERGTEIAIFSKVLEADFLIATGNLEFHYYAGFSGGAKALAPGVASRKTIKRNHQHSLNPQAKAGLTSGNPIREDLEEIGDMVGIDFMVNAILNSRKEAVKVVAGEITKAHRQGVDYINDIFRLQIDELADIVVVSPGGAPKDIDLYQTHKAMENASLAVKEGGIIVVAGECEDGLGEDEFGEALLGDLSPAELVNDIKCNFVLGRHKAARMANIHLHSEIYLVSELAEKIKESLFIKTFDELDKALDRALEVKGAQAKILVIPYGNSTLPNYKGD